MQDPLLAMFPTELHTTIPHNLVAIQGTVYVEPSALQSVVSSAYPVVESNLKSFSNSYYHYAQPKFFPTYGMNPLQNIPKTSDDKVSQSTVLTFIQMAIFTGKTIAS